jgi:hypothetical protein
MQDHFIDTSSIPNQEIYRKCPRSPSISTSIIN